MCEKILKVDHLETSFYTHAGEVKAVRDISFQVEKGKTLGIVGESGSGKSVSLKSVMRLIEHPGKIKGGSVVFDGEEILNKTEKQMLNIRGQRIAMVFQDPMSFLNPVFRIGNQIMESICYHEKVSKAEAKQRAIELLKLVGIPSPEARINNYPHEFSGGMRQRVMIAMALACHPELLIADEPTTALDVTIQLQILKLLSEIQKKEGTTIILVTHDLGVVSELCDRVIVMYGGKIMEEGTVDEIFHEPLHPYTKGLLNSVPSMSESKKRLIPIPGSPPDLLNPPAGCPFCYRCSKAMQLCVDKEPGYFETETGHRCACWLQNPTVQKMLKNKGGRVENG